MCEQAAGRAQPRLSGRVRTQPRAVLHVLSFHRPPPATQRPPPVCLSRARPRGCANDFGFVKIATVLFFFPTHYSLPQSHFLSPPPPNSPTPTPTQPLPLPFSPSRRCVWIFFSPASLSLSLLKLWFSIKDDVCQKGCMTRAGSWVGAGVRCRNG